MKFLALITALFLFASMPVAAQMSNNPNVPITQLPQGGQMQSGDKVHVARCNYAGCDYQVTPGPLISAPLPLSTTLGGTGLSTIGPAGTCLTSTGTELIYAVCGNTPPTPGSFIVTQTQVIIQTQSGVGIVTEQ